MQRGWVEADYRREPRKEIPRPEQVRRTPIRGRWGTLLAQARAEDHNVSLAVKHSETVFGGKRPFVRKEDPIVALNGSQ